MPPLPRWHVPPAPAGLGTLWHSPVYGPSDPAASMPHSSCSQAVWHVLRGVGRAGRYLRACRVRRPALCGSATAPIVPAVLPVSADWPAAAAASCFAAAPGIPQGPEPSPHLPQTRSPARSDRPVLPVWRHATRLRGKPSILCSRSQLAALPAPRSAPSCVPCPPRLASRRLSQSARAFPRAAAELPRSSHHRAVLRRRHAPARTALDPNKSHLHARKVWVRFPAESPVVFRWCARRRHRRTP